MKTSSRAIDFLLAWPPATATGSSSKVTILSLERVVASLEDFNAEGGKGGTGSDTSTERLNSLTLRGTKYSTNGSVELLGPPVEFLVGMALVKLPPTG